MVIFSDGSDLVGIERVQDMLHMQIMKYTLRVCIAWPEREMGEKRTLFLRFYPFCACLEILLFVPGIIYLKNNVGKLTFFELGHTYITVLLNAVSISRLLLTFTDSYQKTIGDFIKTIHLFHFRNKSDYAMKTHILVHKMSHFFTMFMNVIIVSGILFFNFIPLSNNISSGVFSRNRPANFTFEHSIYYHLPFDYTTKTRGIVVMFIFNWYISCICAACVCSVDLILSIIVFHLWGHVRVLIYNLEHFPRPKPKQGSELMSYDNVEIERFSKEELKDVHSTLRDIIRHHQIVIGFRGRISKTFGPTLIIYYAFHQVSGCLLLLECSQMDPKALARYGPLTFILLQQLLQLSVAFELLGSLVRLFMYLRRNSYISTDSLINAVYCLPWECMDTSNRKLVFTMLRQAQLPLNVRAMDMINVGMQTMVSILKTSFSYFIMLRTVAVH